MPKTPESAGAANQRPLPENWGRMTAGQKRSWVAQNRPGESLAPRGPAAARTPAPAARPSPPVATAAPAPELPAAEEETAPGEGEPVYDQEQLGDEEGITITISPADLRKIDGPMLLGEILRAIANGLCGGLEEVQT